MKKMLQSFIPGVVLALICVPQLLAQTPGGAPADTNRAVNATETGQAPDDVMKKISDLVHAGKYAEAQQLTTGLLAAYPDDQRLLKAKTLLDKALASPKPSDPVASSNLPTSTVASPQPASNLTGMDKVDYNALFELAREAQQSTDLKQQNASLQQFMNQSGLFLQKHPTEILLWQLRAASAISLNDAMAGYEAGQRLLAMGAADSNDQNLQRLLAQLKTKGWLDKQGAEEQAKEIGKYGWVLGTWGLHFSRADQRGQVTKSGDEKVEFSRSESVVQAYLVGADGVKETKPRVRGTILDDGEIRWEIAHLPNWQPVLSSQLASDKRTMTLVFSLIIPGKKGQETVTWLFRKD